MLEIYVLLALSINQKVGLSGLLSLAQAVFYGIGAYVTAIIMSKYGLSYWLALPIIIVASIFIALIFSFIAGKVRDLYFALATMAIQIIFFSVIYNWIPVTNGSYGISGISHPQFFGLDINTPLSFSILAGAWVIVIVLFYMWFLKSPLFRLIKASRDDQIALLNLGKNPNFYKAISLIISSVIAAIAGSLYATYVTYIDPSSFTLDESILILSIILIGGAGSLTGPILGAFIYILLPELLKLLDLPDSNSANLRVIIFSVLLIVIVRFKPSGILGNYKIQ